MANQKPQIANKILSEYLISSSRDLKSVGGLVVSGVISTFGVYTLIRPFFTDGEVTNTATLNTAIIAFVIVLIIFDTVKRGAFTKFFNSLLKKKIRDSKLKKGYLFIAIFATVFMIGLDTLGSFSTAEKGANLYSQFKTNSSTEYQILQDNAESGKATANNYSLELSAWKESKSEAYSICNDKWKGWKAKYKAKCKTEWNNDNPMPKQTTTGQIKIEDYKSIKEDNQSFLDKYLFTILFILLSLMTLLMQYLTIAKIYDDYNDIEEGLNSDRVAFINDTIQEHEQILAEHEQRTAELLSKSERVKKEKDRDFTEIGEAIVITHKEKRNDTRAETVKRIANNTYVPKEESKAGFAHNPFAKEAMNQHEKNVRALNDEDEILKKFDSVIKKEEKYQAKEPLTKINLLKKLYSDNLFDFSDDHKKDNRVNKLTPKDKIIDQSKRSEVQSLSSLYTTLLKANCIELRGNKGYFALVPYEVALRTLKDDLSDETKKTNYNFDLGDY